MSSLLPPMLLWPHTRLTQTAWTPLGGARTEYVAPFLDDKQARPQSSVINRNCSLLSRSALRPSTGQKPLLYLLPSAPQLSYRHQSISLAEGRATQDVLLWLEGQPIGHVSRPQGVRGFKLSRLILLAGG